MESYYDDGDVRLYCGDAYKILPQLSSFDLLLTDPPYKLSAKGGGIGAKRQYLSDISGHIDHGFELEILENIPNWCVFCGKHQLRELLNAVNDRRWSLVTWNKPNPTPLSNSNYLPDTEYIVHAYQPGRLFGEYRDKSRFIVHPAEQNSFGHPTVKPLAIMAKMIKLGSQGGDVICDPFAGSGSTLVAAKLLGRKAIGIEREKKYCDIAIQRLSQGVLNLF